MGPFQSARRLLQPLPIPQVVPSGDIAAKDVTDTQPPGRYVDAPRSALS